ncbi:MAG: hypothetical protein ACOYJE_06070 [Bacteroidaceae bacterium]|jgi:hypothetical protein
MKRLRFFPLVLLLIGLQIAGGFLASCHYRQPEEALLDSMPPHERDSVTYLYRYHYTHGTNLTVQSDTLLLAQLPINGLYDTLYRGDTVAVAEFMTDPADSIDTVWVKLAHNQEVQGWIHENEVNDFLMPINPISYGIRQFSALHTRIFMAVFVLFLIYYWIHRRKSKELRRMFFHEVDCAYPLLLCFTTAFCATLYESMQMFCPETWEHFYFNPTLNPFRVPLVLSFFLLGIWGFIIIFIATVEEILKMVRLKFALFYISALSLACILCYLFFIFAVHLWIGYILLPVFLWGLVHKMRGPHRYHYRCGRCGTLMSQKGKCPSCGAINN